jgi:hypothetical protein
MSIEWFWYFNKLPLPMHTHLPRYHTSVSPAAAVLPCMRAAAPPPLPVLKLQKGKKDDAPTPAPYPAWALLLLLAASLGVFGLVYQVGCPVASVCGGGGRDSVRYFRDNTLVSSEEQRRRMNLSRQGRGRGGGGGGGGGGRTFDPAYEAGLRDDPLFAVYSSLDRYMDMDSAHQPNICKLKWEQSERLYGRGSTLWGLNHSNDYGAARASAVGTGPAPAPGQQQQQSVLLVHVGKAAGTTAGAALRRAGIKASLLHVHALTPETIRAFGVVLLCLRDPLQRAVSAYHWRDPGVRLLPARQERLGVGLRSSFYGCFKDVSDYAQRLLEDSRCGTVARVGEGHLEFDTCSYLGGALPALRRHSKGGGRVFVINAESVSADLDKVSASLQWGRAFNTIPHIHDYSKSAVRANLTARAARSLDMYLDITGEKALYEQLQRAFYS